MFRTAVDPSLRVDIVSRESLECDMFDDFSCAPQVRRVIGSTSTSGDLRRGTDPGSVMSIDNGALRIAPSLEPGWGKAAIAYGPLKRRNGLAVVVFMLNGHNTAQVENLPESLKERFNRWWCGSDTYRRPARAIQWLLSGRVLRTLRLFRWWWQLRKGRSELSLQDENLAVGWFADCSPLKPVESGNAFIMHATGPDNGELWARSSGVALPVVHGVQNLPLYYAVVLRDSGAMYYAGSILQTHWLPGGGQLRPLLLDERESGESLYAVVSQGANGQIGFRIDSRVYGVGVKTLPELAQWYGTAHAADTLAGQGLLELQPALPAGQWVLVKGQVSRGADGASMQDATLVLLTPVEPSGLVAVRVIYRDVQGCVGLVWRHGSDGRYLSFDVHPQAASLNANQNGEVRLLAQAKVDIPLNTPTLIQITDDGQFVQAYVGGHRVLEFAVAELTAATGLGVGLQARSHAAGCSLANFEAHPRHIKLPTGLQFQMPAIPGGDHVEFEESFEGERRPLEGKQTTVGQAKWQRLIGIGHIDVLGNGTAQVRASHRAPNPGRTAFVLPWRHTHGADLELKFTVPAVLDNEQHNPRVGFLLWQDTKNYLILNIWRNGGYGGASVSTFFQIDGFEDLYDAVWANIGDRAQYGDTVRLRIAFDGMQYLARVDGEPVLYRKLTDVYPHAKRLNINKVGLVANWEWGNDTGTVLHEFIARSWPASPNRSSGAA